MNGRVLRRATMLKVINVVGARPNFIKVAPLAEAMNRRRAVFTPLIIHTGQHYDAAMSDTFFRDLDLPKPHRYLGVGSGSHATQTAAIMNAFEPVVLEEKPDWVLVVGDVNSTLACALVCVKLGIKVAHVEAGLRSGDRRMPEEINRLLTDQIADLLFTPSHDAGENLRAEGIPEERIHFVGNVMIDSLFRHLERSKHSTIREDLGLRNLDYAILTLHRPSNVDQRETIVSILNALEIISQRIPIIFPAHPRSRGNFAAFGLLDRIAAIKGLRVIEPLGYLDFLRLYSGARLVLTDSGGMQEETSVLGIPCLTLRENTERPITVEMGTNVVVGTDQSKITTAAFSALDHEPGESTPRVPPFWDGRTAERIADVLANHE
jgi:UDP-N-acetylglucosamine 2-epimerase (non-hydrolysing)